MRVVNIIIFLCLTISLVGQNSSKWVVGGTLNSYIDKNKFNYIDWIDTVNGTIHESYVDLESSFLRLLSQKWEVGLGVHIHHRKNTSYDIGAESSGQNFLKNEDTSILSDIGFGLRARYNFVKIKKFKLFLQSSWIRTKQIQKLEHFNFGVKMLDLKDHTWFTNLSLTTGFTVQVKKHLRIIVKYGRVDYSFGENVTYSFRKSIFIKEPVNGFALSLNYFGFGTEWTF